MIKTILTENEVKEQLDFSKIMLVKCVEDIVLTSGFETCNSFTGTYLRSIDENLVGKDSHNLLKKNWKFFNGELTLRNEENEN